MKSNRHHYTYAIDFTRSRLRSRKKVHGRDITAMHLEISESIGLSERRFSSILSRSYQAEEFGEIYRTESLTGLPSLKADQRRIKAAILRTDLGNKMSPEETDELSIAYQNLIDMQRPSGITLTREQEALLPDLIAFAMVGYGLVKSDKSADEKSSKFISPFMHLVQKELDDKSASVREKSDRKYGFSRETHSENQEEPET
jgi:hypothetical protein